MFRKIISILFITLLITGCGKENSKTNDNISSNDSQLNEKLVIKTKLTNIEAKDDSYLVYLMPVGLLNPEPGYANQSGYYGPFETDENGEVEIDLVYNRDLAFYLEKPENKKLNHLEIFISTKEDKYLRNPLNEKTEIEFIKNPTTEPYPEIPYYSAVSEITVPFIDKYPDGVLSLTFQDADFVIKFEFEDDFTPKNSYETFIFWNDPSVPSGIGMINVGRINREFQYWDTPFYKKDNLASKTGTIIVKDFDTNAQINYVGYPKIVSFDKDGKCTSGDIVKITIPKP
jgi:hypothetical protein